MLGLVHDDKHLSRWLGGWLRHLAERRIAPAVTGPRHLLFAICDHFEPLWGHASDQRGTERVLHWLHDYPRLAREFRDSDGRPPRHSFFFPAEQYRPEHLELLASLVKSGLGEVELHLHHDGDTPESLEQRITEALERYAGHGHLARDRDGRVRYGFVHGNWCLANSRDDGRWCGVDSELEVLFETGCYADFTFPSAPDRTQPPIVDQVYWPSGDPRRARAHEHGERARVGEVRTDRILLIQGPLALTRRGRWGVRIENGALSANDPPTPERIRTWVSQAIQIHGRPEWIFVKLHTHGAPEAQAASLLGDAGRRLHQELSRSYRDGDRYVLHYVTAREMYNLAIACMEGRSGDPDQHRDHVLAPPPVYS